MTDHDRALMHLAQAATRATDPETDATTTDRHRYSRLQPVF